MPELPDLTVYAEALAERLSGQRLRGIRIANPFVLRSVEPAPEALTGCAVEDVRRLGKRLVLSLEGSSFIVIHLMIAGRLRWEKPGAAVPGRVGLAAFDFDAGTLVLTEASQKHRAAVHLVAGEAALRAFDAGGVEVFDTTEEEFIAALSRQNHTLKRALTDQHYVAGIGNAYSDEILHRARLSPMRQTRRMTPEEWHTLFQATRAVLSEWTDRLRQQCAGEFPKKVTAFHPEMAVHGKFKFGCPDCGSPVQRIRYASNECNYCAKCQNQGNLLADRALSRLLKQDWPKRLEDLDSIHR